MSEIEREGILAERAEELNKKKLRRDIAALVQLQDESVSAAAKRQHNAPGATKEKNRKLDELKAKRKAREEKGRVRGESVILHNLLISVRASLTLSPRSVPRHQWISKLPTRKTRMALLREPRRKKRSSSKRRKNQL
jgi:hypothetical protein